MVDERIEVALSDLGRWVAVAVLILAGVGLFLWVAPSTRPVIESAIEEVAQ